MCRRPRRAARWVACSTLFLVVAAALTACTAARQPPTPPSGIAYTPVRFQDLAGWTDDHHAIALTALRRSCVKLERLSDGDLGPGPIARPAASWQAACDAAAAVSTTDHAAARTFFETTFTPYRISADGATTGLITGYFEPEMRGSRRRGGIFQVPLYAVPEDLVAVQSVVSDGAGARPAVGRRVGGRIAPYYSRQEIDAGALTGRGLELLWVDDAIDAFFLHIQGSGRVRLDDGQVVRVGYAGKNGHSYVPIGRVLADRGAIPREAVTMHTIRDWLRANPGQAADVMAQNPSYVFFRVVSGDGPIGAQGVPLTAGRSLAVDRRYVPLGAPVWLETVDPLAPSRPLRRLVVAQDTGGAIKGPVRGDLFWGSGEAAGRAAGEMRSRGGIVVLVPRGRTTLASTEAATGRATSAVLSSPWRAPMVRE